MAQVVSTTPAPAAPAAAAAADSNSTAPPEPPVTPATIEPAKMTSVLQVETLLQELGFGEVYDDVTFGAANFRTVCSYHNNLILIILCSRERFCLPRNHSMRT